MMSAMEPTFPASRRLERAILGVALLGMVLAVHLWVQKARGFDQGCLGLQKPALVEPGEGCAEVALLPASHLFGVSNAAWGYAFYFAVALAAFGQLVVGAREARALHRGSAILTLGALVYSMHLVGQMAFVARTWCVLCVVSAALVATLAALHALIWRRGGVRVVDDATRPRELGWGAASLFAAMGLLVAVLLFVNRLGTRPLADGSTRAEFERQVGRVLPQFIDGAKLAELRPCRFDGTVPAIATRALVGAETPFFGAADGVEVAVFIDGNCPYCRAYYPVIRRLMASEGERAKFALVPVALSEEAVGLAAAVRLADRAGRSLAVWDALFARELSAEAALTPGELADLLRAAGVAGADLERRLTTEMAAVRELRFRLRAAGVQQAPAIYIEGRRVWGPSRGEECVRRLIDTTLKSR
jgi:uncharacterized membrane protein/protein-disulfide isomerase